MSSSELVGTASSWLLTYLIHSTILILAVWLLAVGIKPIAARLSPSAANLGWKLALVGGFVTATIQIGVGVRPALGAFEFDSGPTATASEAVASAPIVQLRPQLGSPVAPEATPTVTEAATAVVAGLWGSSLEAPAPEPKPAPLWPRLLLLAIAIGASLASARLLICTRTLRRRLGDRGPVLEDPVLESFLTLCRDSEIGRPVELTQSNRIASPIALGRSEIVVPERAVSELSPAAMRSVLAHELAHLLRRDPLWLAAAAVIEALCFFQPLNRLARRGMQESAELLCDDWAIAHTGDGVLFAKSLAEVATWENANRSSLLLAGMISGEGPIVGRVRRALDGDPRRFERDSSPRPSRMLVGVGSLAALILVAPGAVAASPPDAKPEDPAARELRARNQAATAAAKAQADADAAQARADAAQREAERLAEEARQAAIAANPSVVEPPAPPSGSHLILRDGDEYLMLDENGLRLRSKDADIDLRDGPNPNMRVRIRDNGQELDLDLDLDDLEAISNMAMGMLGQELLGGEGLGGGQFDEIQQLGGLLDAFGGFDGGAGFDGDAMEREFEAIERELEEQLLRELGRGFGGLGGGAPSAAPVMPAPSAPTPAPAPTTMI